MVFLLALGLANWTLIAGLAIGGMLAAPFGAYLVSRIRPKPFQVAVGVLVIVLSLRTLWKSIG